MCDVTRSNFVQLLPEILDAVGRASWLSFDCEYTALRPGEPAGRLSDTPESRHQRHVAAVAAAGGHTAIINQFGLAIFIEDLDARTPSLLYVARVYNFFLCPRAATASLDEEFVCQASSLAFLGRHGFDFNRWVGEGLGWLSREQEAELRREVGQGTLFETVARGLAHEDADRIQHFCSQAARIFPQKLWKFSDRKSILSSTV